MKIPSVLLILALSLGASPAGAAAQSACVGPGTDEERFRSMIVGVVTTGGPAADQARQTWNLPQVVASEVMLVSDSATCAQALNTMVARGSTAVGPVLLYRVGSTRYVLGVPEDADEHFVTLHVLDGVLCYLSSVAM